MSLGIIIKAPEGIVLAAESRVTLSTPGIAATGNPNGNVLHVNFDNANKVLTFSPPFTGFGVVTWGQAAIGFRTAQSFIPEFETYLQKKIGDPKSVPALSVLEFAKELSDFFSAQWKLAMPDPYNGPNMTFNVAGFDDSEPYGKVYAVNIPRIPQPVEQTPQINGQVQFGIVWGGQREIVDRLVMGFDSRIFDLLVKGGVIKQTDIPRVAPLLQQLQLPMPIQFMPLQDCVNLAMLFIETTIKAQSLTVGLRGCGGPIDVAIITRHGKLEFIKKKEIKAY